MSEASWLRGPGLGVRPVDPARPAFGGTGMGAHEIHPRIGGGPWDCCGPW